MRDRLLQACHHLASCFKMKKPQLSPAHLSAHYPPGGALIGPAQLGALWLVDIMNEKETSQHFLYFL